jgi:hypothetical protein
MMGLNFSSNSTCFLSISVPAGSLALNQLTTSAVIAPIVLTSSAENLSLI